MTIQNQNKEKDDLYGSSRMQDGTITVCLVFLYLVELRIVNSTARLKRIFTVKIVQFI
jgi:hypothetical protein